jgi:hypothetical protein
MKPAPHERGPGRLAPPGREIAPAGWLECAAAGMLSAVIVSRLLTPTDAAAVGETIWIAQFVLLNLVVWIFAAYRAGTLAVSFDCIDAAALLLCLGHVVGAMVVITGDGDGRAALNLLWEWCGVATTFFLVRRLAATPERRRSLLLVVLATAVALAGLGVWQTYGGYAESRREYALARSEMESLQRSGRPADPRAAAKWEQAMDRARARFASLNVPTDESSRMLFERRLQSSEPIGLFALANTLAGVLACAAVVWLGVLVESGPRASRWQSAIGGLLGLLILYCLLLTKSRTAFVGLLSGLAVWGAGAGLRRSTARRRRRWILAGGLLVVGLIVAAVASGGLDRFVVSESAKSLRYRFEYWQATWRMLADGPRHCLFGVGAGNFRQNYLPFKLAQSSEEIADPHNMVLDVWANGGMIALAGLAGICAAGLRPLWRSARAAVADDAGRPGWRDPLLAGGALGFLAAFIAGGASDERMVPLFCGWLCVVAACRALFSRDLPAVVYAAGCAVLAVHLLGAGGIGMPAVTQLVLLLVIFGAAADPPPHWELATTSRGAIAVAGVAGLGLYLSCWFTGLTPVLSTREKLAAARYEYFDRHSPARAERELLLAAQADPWSAEPYQQLSQLAFQNWLAGSVTNRAAFDRCVAWQRTAIDRDPQNYGGYRQLGEMYLEKFGRTAEKSDATAAADAFAMALARYPNHAAVQAGLAEALWNAGAQEAASAAARRALELDAINEQAGHIDKRLPATKQESLKPIAEKKAN